MALDDARYGLPRNGVAHNGVSRNGTGRRLALIADEDPSVVWLLRRALVDDFDVTIARLPSASTAADVYLSRRDARGAGVWAIATLDAIKASVMKNSFIAYSSCLSGSRPGFSRGGT